MKNVCMSLMISILLFSSAKPCEKWFTLRKISCIFENIVRRVEKNPYDYLDAEITNTINSFQSEHRLACCSCRYNAEFQSLHLIEYLKRHMKRYKKIVITAM